MVTFLIILAVFLALALWYALTGRAWLKSKPWAQPYFNFVEPLEIALYKKSETLLVGRLVWLGGAIVTLYDGLAAFASSLDLTPIQTRVFDAAHVPADMRGVATAALFTGLGLLISWLRKRVTQPIEVVAVAQKDITPKVAEAIAIADATKTEAVAAVVEAKAA